MRFSIMFLAITILLLIAIGLGCGSDDKKVTNPANTVPASLVGTWWFASATHNGIPYGSFAEISFTDTSETGAVTINANDTWSTKETYNDQIVYTRSGTIKVHGDTVKITVTVENGDPADADDTSSSAWNVNGTVLTLSARAIALNDTINIVSVYNKE
ncbi:exported hypothetical protein [Candidatus Zixiibacteriota bacterium]|nr:exported hypothetical protein [candidate division Zixibacteria bacterium]